MIRAMTQGDIPGAMRLKEAAGWNQTPADWARLLALEPEGCFVDERDGEAAGTATALRYGPEAAWVGMVLVAPERRRQGIARGLMRHALAWLRGRGARRIKLDASDMGLPLYRQLGFVDEQPIERWMRRPSSRERLKADVRPSQTDCPLGPARIDSCRELDRLAFGADRGALLAALAAAEDGVGFAGGGGYLLGRPGSEAWFLGPCAARGEAAAGGLVSAFLAERAGEAVFWDLLPANAPAARLARRFGFRPHRRLMRMALEDEGAPPFGAAHPEYLYAAAGFEFG